MAIDRTAIKQPPKWRWVFMLMVITIWFGGLGWRVVLIHTEEHEHLQSEGDRRYLREVRVEPERGAIFDRNEQALTVSTPVQSLVADPGLFCVAEDGWAQMAVLIDTSVAKLIERCDRYKQSEFMYVKRRLAPSVAEEVMGLDIAGLELRQEYKRFYPGGSAGSHLVGFTDVDNQGQEGLEHLYDSVLRGVPGRKRVLKSLSGQYVESVESVAAVRHGENLTISIDQRLQSLASEYLEDAIGETQSVAGSVVVLSIPSGEILTMVNHPQFNPNDRRTFKNDRMRNRAVTDVFEPGSTIKPFTVAMALETGEVGTQTRVDTSPGTWRIGSQTISDTKWPLASPGRFNVFSPNPTADNASKSTPSSKDKFNFAEPMLLDFTTTSNKVNSP